MEFCKVGLKLTSFVIVILSCQGSHRNIRALSFFNVVQFPNDKCTGTTAAAGTRLGTCYTPEECDAKGGESSGSCANGYGVCCVFIMTCGSSSSERTVYLIQQANAYPATNQNEQQCSFVINKYAPGVTRLRFDFTTFQINPPILGQTVATGTNIPAAAGAIGQCATDQFAITSSGASGSPVICGINTGQHVIVDATDGGSIAVFSFSQHTGLPAREYDITVTQFEPGNNLGGPPGCLQYFVTDVGNVASFNFDIKAPSVTSTATHLANQMYNICFRRNVNKCSICYIPAIALVNGATTVNTQSSFGLSVTIAGSAGTLNVLDKECGTDYIIIPFGARLPLTNPPNLAGSTSNRFCGRVLSTMASQDSSAAYATFFSVCTNFRPFVLTFFSDDTEKSIGGGGDEITHEEDNAPGGIIGFNLRFEQKAC